jgi:creatinine amidohydrolase/Fe(II)-dependent formamide hydrolase-like protein
LNLSRISRKWSTGFAVRAALVFVLLGLITGRGLAQVPDTVFLEDLTWTELRDQIAGGKTTVLVPIGGTEQNGPAMALGKHNVRVKLLSERIARRLGNAIVAPVMAYVPEGNVEPPTAHMKFPGTITMPESVFEKVLESAARSFKHHGFRDIVLIGEHGGYQKSLKVVAERLNREWAKTPVRVHALSEYYDATEQPFAQLLKQRGYRDDEIGTHAGLTDTSLSLALAPGLVRVPRLTQSPPLGRADGVYGDPRRASAELGQLGAELIVTRSVEAIKQRIKR